MELGKLDMAMKNFELASELGYKEKYGNEVEELKEKIKTDANKG